MNKTLAAPALLATLAACNSAPQSAADQRETLNDQVLPAKDQAGIALIFPIEAGGFNSVFQIVYLPDEVTEAELQSRIARICNANGTDGRIHVWRPSAPTQITQADGSKRSAQTTIISCFSR